jgi:hypothetical protein
LSPGSATSRIKQLGASSRGQARNSWAEPNVSGRQPSERINDFNDSRTEMSSSTTKTTGLILEYSVIPKPWPSKHARLITDSLISGIAFFSREGFGHEYSAIPSACLNAPPIPPLLQNDFKAVGNRKS